MRAAQFLLFITVCYTPGAIANETVTRNAISVHGAMEGRLVGNASSYAQSGRDMSLAELLSSDSALQFAPRRQTAPNIGFSRNAHWFRLDITNADDTIFHGVLSVKFPYLENVDFAYVEDGKVIHTAQAGAARKISTGQISSHFPSFSFSTPPHKSAQIYVKISSDTLIMAPLKLAPAEAFVADNARSQALFAVNLGIVIAVILYAAVFYFSIGNRVFIAFQAFLLSLLAYVLTSSGLAKHWFFADAAFNANIVYFIAQSALFASTGWFFQQFLKTKTSAPFADKVLTCFIGAALFSAFAPWMPDAIGSAIFFLLAGGPASLFLLGLSIWLWRKGCADARITAIGWGVSQVSVVYVYLRLFDVTPYHEINHYLMAVSCSFAAIIFAFAIAQSLRRQAERLSALDRQQAAQAQFFSGLTHDLRTPLNAIINFSDILSKQKDYDLADKEKLEMLRHVNDAGVHMLKMVNDILDHSKAQAGAYTLAYDREDVAYVIRNCMEMVSELAKTGGVKISFNDAPESFFADIDAQALRRVLTNLLSNAIKFTEEGGHVDIILDPDAAPESFKISVVDTGIGIAKKDLDKVISAYGQTGSRSSQNRGTGLGLPMAKSLIELHHGCFSIDSEPGVGTRIEMTLPLNAPSIRLDENGHKRKHRAGS